VNITSSSIAKKAKKQKWKKKGHDLRFREHREFINLGALGNAYF
jgi:hypothetical protein